MDFNEESPTGESKETQPPLSLAAGRSGISRCRRPAAKERGGYVSPAAPVRLSSLKSIKPCSLYYTLTKSLVPENGDFSAM